VLQWLLNAETSHPTSSPPHRLARFFSTLHSALRNPSRAVLQFYPSSDDQVQLITSIAQRAGFGGGVVVDYPNSKKARKVFLCLFVGDGGGSGGGVAQVPEGLQAEGDGEDAKAKFEGRRRRESRRERNGKQKVIKGGRDWILRKKDVRVALVKSASSLSPPPSDFSCTADEERRACLTTPSTRVAKEGRYSRMRFLPFLPRVATRNSVMPARKTNRSFVCLFFLLSRAQKLSRGCYGIFCFVSDERALQRRHADPATVFYAIAHYLLHLPSLELHLVVGSVVFRWPIAVKVCEERSGLLWNGVVDESCQVNAAGPDECGIESVQVVRREEYDPLFTRGDAVQSVQEP
jgi:hypothetical protein